MKAKAKFGLTGYTGNVDDMIFYTLPHSDEMIGRRKPTHFTPSPHHNDYRIIAQNLKKIKPTDAYKDDFKVYTTLYREIPDAIKTVASWYNLYIAMLWAMQDDGLMNLKTVTRNQIINNNLPCKTVKAAVEAGYLPPVLNWQSLDNNI